MTDTATRKPATDAGFSLDDMFTHGNLTPKQVQALKNMGHSKFYHDVKKGIVSIRKIGRKSVVPGPVARAYINGEG